MIAGGAPAVRSPVPWVDPRSFVADRGILLEDEGMRDLFARLQASGPTRVPSRADAARIARRSLATFKRHIPLLTGRSWRGFIRRWRATCARDRLTALLASENAIARTCGFRSTAALSRAFKVEFGMTPSAFRAARRRWGRLGRPGAGEGT